MTDQTLKCPDCVGVMELQPIDGSPYFVCFVCNRKLSLAEYEDHRRWWGSWHLPLIDIVYRPRQAIQQMRNHPVPFASLALFSLMYWIEHWKSSGVVFPGVRFSPLVMGYAAFLFFLAEEFFLAGVLHQLARWMGGRGRFRDFWPIILVLSTVFGSLHFLPFQAALFNWAVSLAAFGYSVLTVQEFYHLDLFDAAMTNLIAWAIRGTLWLVLAMLMGVSHFGAFGRGFKRPSRDTHASVTAVHRSADFNVTFYLLNGPPLHLSDLQGKVIFLNFWATWCMPCRIEMDGIERLAQHFKDNPNIAFILATDESPQVLQGFLAKNHYSLPFYGYNGTLPATYAHDALPTTYILSPAGEIVGEHAGAAHWDSPGNIQYIQNLVHPIAKPAQDTSHGR